MLGDACGSEWIRSAPIIRGLKGPPGPSLPSPCALVAAGGAGVGEGLARDWDELPVVAFRAEGQLQHAVRARVLAELLGFGYCNGFRPAPPVPTTNSLMPLSRSIVPFGLWSTKRS